MAFNKIEKTNNIQTTTKFPLKEKIKHFFHDIFHDKKKLTVFSLIIAVIIASAAL